MRPPAGRPLGRISRPENSVQRLEKVQNRLGNRRRLQRSAPGLLGGRPDARGAGVAALDGGAARTPTVMRRFCKPVRPQPEDVPTSGVRVALSSPGAACASFDASASDAAPPRPRGRRPRRRGGLRRSGRGRPGRGGRALGALPGGCADAAARRGDGRCGLARPPGAERRPRSAPARRRAGAERRPGRGQAVRRSERRLAEREPARRHRRLEAGARQIRDHLVALRRGRDLRQPDRRRPPGL